MARFGTEESLHVHCLDALAALVRGCDRARLAEYRVPTAVSASMHTFRANPAVLAHATALLRILAQSSLCRVSFCSFSCIFKLQHKNETKQNRETAPGGCWRRYIAGRAVPRTRGTRHTPRHRCRQRRSLHCPRLHPFVVITFPSHVLFVFSFTHIKIQTARHWCSTLAMTRRGACPPSWPPHTPATRSSRPRARRMSVRCSRPPRAPSFDHPSHTHAHTPTRSKRKKNRENAFLHEREKHSQGRAGRS